MNEKYKVTPIPTGCTRVVNSNGEAFDIPVAHPEFEKLYNFAKDVDVQKKMKLVGIKDPQKQCDAYLKYHLVINDKPRTDSISDQERHRLEQKPSMNGIGLGKSGEELNAILNRHHREEESSYPDSHRINIPIRR